MMKKIVWEMQYISAPPVVRYCRKCRDKKAFICSGQFRINAQRKLLDIWLIYKCSDCDATWNAAIYSRISPGALKPELLDAFYKNDRTLAEQFAMNSDFLRKNGAEIGQLRYSVMGEDFLVNEAIMLEIKSKYSFNIKISSIIREKRHLSQKDYLGLIRDGKIKSIPEMDLCRCRIKKGVTRILFRV